MKFRIRTPLALAAALILAGCKDTGVEVVSRTVQGSVTFTYAGDVEGSFNATGSFTVPDPGSAAFAAGRLGPIQGSAQALTVLAHQPLPGDTLANEVLLAVRNPELGTVACEVGETGCTFSGFFFSEVASSGATEGFYGSTGGTITITSLENGRAKGTFALELVRLEADEEPELQITSGTFDVPLLTDSEF